MSEIYTGWGTTKPARKGWPISGIWPLESVLLVESETRPQDTTAWIFEPSGYVGEMEICATPVQRSIVDLEFDQQKAAFNEIPPLVLLPFQGLFVASRNGEIVDSDANLPSLTNRFFSQYGDVPVYITRVGGRRRVLLRTPRHR
jgi:hypothetical protein